MLSEVSIFYLFMLFVRFLSVRPTDIVLVAAKQTIFRAAKFSENFEVRSDASWVHTLHAQQDFLDACSGLLPHTEDICFYKICT